MPSRLPRLMTALVAGAILSATLAGISPTPSPASATPTRAGGPAATDQSTASPAATDPSIVGPAAVSPAAGSPAATDAGHPFSNPVYYPLRASSRLDCVKRNPGCANPHSFWTMDMVPAGQKQPDRDLMSHAGVYAMGAGILHIGQGHGTACPSADASFGTWVWVDHGGGMLSRYGHLSRIMARPGRVAAGQLIGLVGTTGKRVNCNVAYTDFMVKTNGIIGLLAHTVQMRTLIACSGRASAVWPTAAPGLSSYRTWNEVPAGATLPASTGNCLPAATPATPNQPRAVLARSGSGALTARWAAAPAAAHVRQVMIRFETYHPSLHAYGSPVYRTVGGAGPSRFTKLMNGRDYRAQISFRNAAGWSAPTRWLVAAPASRPTTPALRSVRSTSSAIHFHWTKSRGNGEDVTGYTLGRRRQHADGTYPRWSYRTVAASVFHYSFRGLRAHTRYQIKVRAQNRVGSSGWLKKTSTTSR